MQLYLYILLTFHVPKPSIGISRPLFNLTLGTFAAELAIMEDSFRNLT